MPTRRWKRFPQVLKKSVEKVVVHRGKVAQRSMMTLSLSFDHRLVDGAPAATFLQTIKGYLEEASELNML